MLSSVVGRVREQDVVTELVPLESASGPDEYVDGRDEWGRGRVLRGQDDGVNGPLELGLGERVGDGAAADGEEARAWCGGVDLDGLDADDEGVVVCEVDGLYAVVGLGRVSR